jgi:hypothetical protein
MARQIGRCYKCKGKKGRLLRGRRRGLAMKEGRWVGRMVGGDREGMHVATWAEGRRYKEKHAFGCLEVGKGCIYCMGNAFKWAEKDIINKCVQMHASAHKHK